MNVREQKERDTGESRTRGVKDRDVDEGQGDDDAAGASLPERDCQSKAAGARDCRSEAAGARLSERDCQSDPAGARLPEQDCRSEGLPE